MLTLVVALVLGALAILALVWFFYPSRGAASEQAELAEAVTRAKADIARVGWHIVLVEGEDTPGFLYTVGLWQSYQHPELLIVAPGKEASGFAANISELGKRVAGGEVLAANVPIDKAFAKFDGVAREIHKNWRPRYFGVAEGVYEGREYPALQVFWPDRQSRYPWESQADSKIFSAQPLLDQENPILANLGRAEIRRIFEEENGKARLDAGLQELLVPEPAGADLLETWRWLVGKDVEVFKITAFGDMILTNERGQLYWLDIGFGTFDELPATRETWLPDFYSIAFEFVHVRLLLELKALDYVRAEDQVFDWIKAPMFGGDRSKDNVQKMPLTVAASSSGQLAQKRHQRAPSANPG